MRNSRNAGLLYGVVPPSTKTKDFSGSSGSHETTSGGKNTGAALLARTICHSGMFRLQSGRDRSLYVANGLELIGQAESVVALRVTTTSRQRRCSGLRSVSRPNVSRSVSASPPCSYRLFQRTHSLRRENAVSPNAS